MKKKGFMSKLYTGKGFYITAAVCLGLMAVAIGVMYRASSNLISEIAYDGQQTEYIITEEAQAEKTDEADPRASISETQETQAFYLMFSKYLLKAFRGQALKTAMNKIDKVHMELTL